MLTRAEQAETYLKRRDEEVLANLSPADLAYALKAQNMQLTEEKVLETKKATAGWDAAARADEEATIAKQQAYEDGAKEERDKHKRDGEDLNLAIEAKEVKITELLVALGLMEHQV
jgi:hypothetical protein